MRALFRWLTILAIAFSLMGLGFTAASATPTAETNSPPVRPYVGSQITISDFDEVESVPDIAYNRRHDEYLVVWQTANPYRIRGARISGTGQLLANFPINGGPGFQPAAAYDPVHDRYLVVFIFGSSNNPNKPDLLGRFIPWDGPDPSLKSFPIVTWPTTQIHPDVAYGRALEEFVVVWTNLYTPPSPLPHYISGKRIRAADGSFPGSGSDMSISHPTQDLLNPSVTYNLARNEYLVVYDNHADILGKRFTGNLNHDFGGEFAIATWPDGESSASAAACHGADQYLVAWQSDQGGGNDAIYGRFISGSGALGSVHNIDDSTGPERKPSVSCNDAGNQYLVAWQTEYTNLKYGVWARFVQPDKKMGSSFPVQDPFNQSHRINAVVSGGRTSYLAAWEVERGNSGFWDIHGRTITPFTNFLPVTIGR